MNKGFKLVKKGELEYLTVPSFEETGLVRHCFTTRLGGVSTGEAASLNLSYKRNDSPENVRENFRIICEAIGVDHNKIVFSDQTHKKGIYIATTDDLGKGLHRESDISDADGLVTQQKDVPLCTFYADCVPLFFLDPVKKITSAVHSGWKSTLLEIGKEAVSVMKDMGSNPDDILAAIGPSIGPCHFEVRGDVAEQFTDKFGMEILDRTVGDKSFINLWKTNVNILIASGIRERNITLAEECTYCNRDRFYSYRGDDHKTGSLCGIIQLV
ncbi:MAG: peptidoglycan editing factor PgeF [Eubacteriales bacterium]|nr:peptidoglycan editing factor PgeF [Eubacteriales bacterium]